MRWFQAAFRSSPFLISICGPPVANPHNRVTFTSLICNPNTQALDMLIIHFKTQLNTLEVLLHAEGNSSPVSSWSVFHEQWGSFTTVFHSCELSHHVSVIAKRSKPCDSTQIYSSSCLFPIVPALVYRHFIEGFDCVNIPGSVQRDAP